ncbi:MAG: hypothetical protein WAT39_07535 [Planctomycetota bacterium]
MAPFHGVFLDEHRHADGGHWARGDRYKVRFAADGVHYLPLFSSRTPRHYPLHFLGVAGGDGSGARIEPVLRENGCSFDRGDVVERWDLRPEGAEQSFVLRRRPVGDVLTLPVTTDLVFLGNGPNGLRFLAEGWGEVAYGQAFAIGGAGERTALPTTWTGAAIRIELPADARYPLTVDPLVSTIGVASAEPFDNRNPDVAFDQESGRWAVVMEERVSAFDTDIKVRRFDAAGVLVDTDYFEVAGAVATQPAIAASTGPSIPGTFLVAWIEGGGILMRRLIGTGASPLTTTSVGSSSVEALDVGGSPEDRFMIVFVEDGPLSSPDLRTTYVNHLGLPQGSTSRGTFNGCIRPRIANMVPGLLDHWFIAFSDQLSGCLAGDVKFLIMADDNTQWWPNTTIAGAVIDDDRNVAVAWNGNQGLIVWDRDMGSQRDIFAQLVERTGTVYSLVGSPENLSAMEPGITLSADQHQPVITTDGLRFAVCYMEGSTPRPVCATFAVTGGVIVCHEGHVPVITANLPHDNHAIASMGTTGGPLTRYLVVADERDGSNDYDVEGAFYDGRQTGAMFTTVNTGCTPIGFPEPLLTPTGGTDLGNTFSMTISAHRGLPFILVSSPLSPTQLLCTAHSIQQCRLGVALPLILAQLGTSIAVPVPANTALVGANIAFQGLDLNASGACNATLLGLPFVVTDTVHATVR